MACGDIVVLLADTIWYNYESPGGSPNWQMSAISGHGRYYPKEEKLSLKFYHNHNVFDWTLVKQSSTEINGTYGNNWPELSVDSVSLLEQTDSDSIYLSMHLRQYQDAFDSALTNIVLPKFTCATHDYEISVAENFRARFDITYLDNQLFMEVDKVDEDYNGNGYTYYIHQYYTFVGTRTP
ncbi:MAG: hypothetical protein KDB98_07405 [Flavobacteriales bacterium]|nr:hypothetical protein [Flavobacteriales bacterium]